MGLVVFRSTMQVDRPIRIISPLGFAQKSGHACTRFRPESLSPVIVGKRLKRRHWTPFQSQGARACISFLDGDYEAVASRFASTPN